MADHALTTPSAARRLPPSDAPRARIVTTAPPGEILLGADDTGGLLLRIPATTSREDIEAVAAAVADMLARMGAPLIDIEPIAPSPVFHTITPTADQQRAAYRANGDRLPANLRGRSAWVFGG